MSKFLHIRTEKFLVLDGEMEEVANPGTFGKSFAQYIETALRKAGYEVPSVTCEDWGWWVDVSLPSVNIGITCYRDHDKNTECAFACSPSPEKDKVWSWTKFRFIDISEDLAVIQKTLREAFKEDPDIEFVGESEDLPLLIGEQPS